MTMDSNQSYSNTQTSLKSDPPKNGTSLANQNKNFNEVWMPSIFLTVVKAQLNQTKLNNLTVLERCST